MDGNPGPSQAQSMYLDSRKGEIRESTRQTHEYRLNHFVRWCNENEVDDLADLDAIDVERYKNWRRKDGDLSKSALKGQLDTLRVYLRYLGRLEIFDPELCESVPNVTMKRTDEVNERKIDEDNAEIFSRG